MAKIRNIEIEDAQIRFRNFSGKPDDYNKQGGKRTFCVLLNPALADELKEEGWNIKYLRPRDDEEEPTPYIQVRVSYDNVPPKVWMVTNSKKTLLDEESISSLDYVDIQSVDLVISPYEWEVNGKSGVSAYLANMYVTIIEDRFASKYSELD